MNYFDAMVCAVANTARDAYREHAERMARVFKENGALSVVDCWGDDVPEGKLTSFPMAVKRGPDETVVFSWICWPSREVRDAAWKKLMDDPGMNPQDMPFDGKRMIFGGFQQIVDA